MMHEFDLRAVLAAFYAEPYPTYHALRAADPVRRMPDGSLFPTRYDDVAAVYRDGRVFSSDKQREFVPKFGVGSLVFSHALARLGRRIAIGGFVQRFPGFD